MIGAARPAPLIGVTRRGDGAGELGRSLRELGAQVVEVPLLRFGPPADPAALRARLSDLRGVNWLLVTSPQGAGALLEQLTPAGLSGIRIAAVGSGTARRLAAGGIEVDYLPPQARGNVLGEQLPAQPGELALHVTSQLSEKVLRDALLARGIRYEQAELYRTEPAEPTSQERQLLRRADAVTLASGSAARALAALAETGFDPLALPVAVMGPQAAAAAQAVGFRQVVMRDVSLRGLAQAALAAAGQTRAVSGTGGGC